MTGPLELCAIILAQMAKAKQKPQPTKRKRVTHVPLAVITQMLTLATSGFGLVAALAWNSFIQEFVNSYVKKFLPDGSGLVSLFIYAIVVTALAVAVTLQLTYIKERLGR